MNDKSEWPDAEKLAELRLEGKFPLSFFSLSCLGLSAFFLAVYLQSADFAEMKRLWYLMGGSGASAILESPGRDFLSHGLKLLMVPLAAVLMAVLAGGLFQSACLIRPSALAFNPGRLNPFASSSAHGLLSAFGRSVAACVLAIVIAALMLYFVAGRVFMLLNQDAADWASQLAQWFKLSLPVALISLGIAAFFGWLIRRFTFMLEHRFSRAERGRSDG